MQLRNHFYSHRKLYVLICISAALLGIAAGLTYYLLAAKSRVSKIPRQMPYEMPYEMPHEMPLQEGICQYEEATRIRRHTVNIAEFGAVGDGITLNTDAFQKAITNLSSFADQGGGQLYVPKGRWLTGSFNLTSHFTLFLDKDAIILGSENFEDWPIIDPLPSYGRGREFPGGRHISLIHGVNLTDVLITGENGTIDGQGDVWWNAYEDEDLNYTRGHLLELVDSQDIVITNLTFKNSPFWTIHPVYCRKVYIQNLTILAPKSSPNTDGIDPDSSSDVCIQDCYIDNGDDMVVIKSGWDQYGYKYGKPSTNIVVRNIVGKTDKSAGFAIGSEMSGGVSDIFVENMVVYNAYMGVRIKSSEGRGGYIRNIYIRNITVHTARVGIGFSSSYDEHPDDDWDPDALPLVEKLVIGDVTGFNVTYAGRLLSLPENTFKDIYLYNIKMNTSTHFSKAWNCSFVTGSSWNVLPKPCPEISPKT